jgi:pilus assembly protein CpaF
MMQAMNTGHDGSMTTVHANTARDAFSRLETMVMMASQHVPDYVIRQMLSAAVQLVVHMNRLPDGSRKIVTIAEVNETEDGETVEMHDVFRLERQGVSQSGKVLGRFRGTGYIPKCLQRLKSYGIHVSPTIFREEHVLK